MRVALHDEAVAEAEMIKERDEALDRRVGRRVAAARLIRKLVRWTENMRVRVPGAGRRFYARRVRHRPGNARRVIRNISSPPCLPQLDIRFLHHAAPQRHLVFNIGVEFFR